MIRFAESVLGTSIPGQNALIIEEFVTMKMMSRFDFTCPTTCINTTRARALVTGLVPGLVTGLAAGLMTGLSMGLVAASWIMVIC